MKIYGLIIIPLMMGMLVISCATRVTTVKDIENIQDQNELAQIAIKSREIAVEMAAIRKIDDQTLLVNIASSSGNEDSISAAIEKITDQALLIKLYAHVNSKIKLGLVKKITDQEWLEKLVLDDWWGISKELKMVAFENITDQSALTRIALQHNRYEDIPIFALKKLTDRACQ